MVSLLPELLPPTPARERVEVTPAWFFRLPLRNGSDGVLRRRGDVLERLLHVGEHAVLVRVAQPARERVVLGAWAADRVAAREALTRMRFALSVDDDLAPFHARFAKDPLIGRSLRARPWLRVARRPQAFEALAWAICEQLIEFTRAAAIERRIVWRLGRSCAHTGLCDLPTPASVAATAPALLESMDLAHRRALTLVRVAREISRGRAVLEDADQQSTLRRLRRVPGVGPWTLAMLSLAGLGRYDAVPAGDVNLLKRAGRLLAGGDPRGFASETEVLELLAPYGSWAGLAAMHLMTAPTLACPDDRPTSYRARLGGRAPVPPLVASSMLRSAAADASGPPARAGGPFSLGARWRCAHGAHDPPSNRGAQSGKGIAAPIAAAQTQRGRPPAGPGQPQLGHRDVPVAQRAHSPHDGVVMQPQQPPVGHRQQRAR